MLHRILSGVFCALFGVMAYAATDSGSVQIQRITPAGEDVPAGRQIVIQFNRAMVPLGRMERRADEVPVSISPSVACEWRWLNSSALACQLSESAALKPATEYRVTVKKGFAAVDGATLAKPVSHRFITERPKLEQVYFQTWQGPGSPVARLQFNLPVTRNSVEDALHFRDASGRTIGLTLGQVTAQRDDAPKVLPLPGEQMFIVARPVAGEPQEGLVRRYWDVMPATPLAEGSRASLWVTPGLVTPQGPLSGMERREALGFDTFPEFRFLGVRCQSNDNKTLRLLPPVGRGACNPMQSVFLEFSAPVLSDEIRDHVRFDPDLAGNRKDYDPWQNVQSYSALYGAYQKGRTYTVYLPERLQARKQYRVTETSPVHDEFGRPLDNLFDIIFQTDARPPNLVLPYRQAVIESQVANDVPVTVTNLKALRMAYSGLTGAGVVPESTVRLPLPSPEDIAFNYPLGLHERLGQRSGVITGVLEPEPRFSGYRQEDYRFFAQATPFQMHVKLGHFNSLVWVTDLATGKPVANARVRVYLDDYLQLDATPSPLGEAATDDGGLATLPGRYQLDPGLEYQNQWDWKLPRLFVRIDRGDDLALLPLDGNFEISSGAVTDWNVYGWARPKDGFVRAWGTTAQGVYRAGDKIQYKVYVRNQDNRSLTPAPAGPYQLKIIDPTGKPVAELKDIQLDEFGALAGEFASPASGAVGWYRFELHADYLPNPLPALQVLVADFTPAEFRVSSRLNGDLFLAGDKVAVDTQASMYAGGPYASAKARITARLYPRALQPQGTVLQGFYFQTLRDNRSPETVFQTEAHVGTDGELLTDFKLDAEHVLYGRLDVESAVSDDRGKYVAGFASASYAGRDRYVGLRQQGWLLQQDEPAAVDVIAVDAAGKPAPTTPVVVRVEHEKITAARVKGAGNAFITRYNQEWREVARCELETAAEAVECRFTPPEAGRYRIIAELTDTQGRSHQTQLQQWAAGKGRVLWAEQPNNSLEIVPEQESYQVGETARYLVKNPFPGAQALITVERYGVMAQRVHQLDDSTSVLEVPVTEDLIPGFYLSVVVTSPRVEAPPADGEADLGRPTMRMGYVKTEVRDQYKELLIEASPAQPQYRPGDTVQIDLSASPRHGQRQPMQLAAVVLDEAVFDLIQGGEQYFDPYQGFYQLEALDLANYSLLTRLIGLQKFEKKGANAGGDGGDMDARRIDRYVSYWNPDVRLDSEGRARIEFEAPDNLTSWRVLVLGVTAGDRLGLGQTRFKVNQATEIRPVMPNQVLQGDRFQAGFSVMNRTDRARVLTLQWRVDGLGGDSELMEQSLPLQPYQREVVYMPVQTRQPGLLRFTLTAGDDSDRDRLSHELPVRQKSSHLTAASYGSLVGGSIEESLQYPNKIQPDVGGLSVVLSPSVIGNIDGAFEYLRDYPYNSWEQLLSKAVMASHYITLRAYVRPEFSWPEAQALPAQILAQASSYQAPSGGMAFFKADDAYVSPYLSAYTALAFNWLRASGHEVPKLVEQQLHGYLRTLLRRDVVPEFYSPGMASTVRAVALAALAEQGAVDRDDLERYRRHVPAMSLFGKAHYLQAAMAVAGTETTQQEVLDLILSHGIQSGGKFSFNEALDDGYARILSTPARSQCAILSALSRLAAAPQGADWIGDIPPRLTRSVTQARGDRDHWENTQENLFCMNALINYARVFEQTDPGVQARVRLDDMPLGEVHFDTVRDDAVELEQPMRPDDVGAGRVVHLDAVGAGRLYYSLRLRYSPVAIDPKPVNAGIELQREYSIRRNDKWQLLESPVQLRRGELVRVDLYLSLPTARNYVVIDDPVAGGLEPVNRQLATASSVDADAGVFEAAGGSWYLQYSDWIGYNVSRWSFYHQELRHDAVRFYSDYLSPGNYHLSYTAQAIADGEFSAPGAHAEEMYDPDVFGKASPAVLQVGE